MYPPKQFNRPFNNKKQQLKNKINNQITAKEVRLVSLPEGYAEGIYEYGKAMDIANKLGLDLIQVSPDGVEPVVCKIMELSKFRYEQKQKEKEKNKNKGGQTKEIWLSQNIGDHDLETKAKKANEFLGDNNKVKVTLEFKGRGIIFKDQGTMVMMKFAELVKEQGLPESLPSMEGKRMYFTLKPKKK